MKHNVFRDGHVHVCAEMCETCVFRPGNRMHLKSGRVKEMVDAARRDDSTIVCHATLDGDNAACRGFFDRYATAPLQIAERTGLIRFIKPPRKDNAMTDREMNDKQATAFQEINDNWPVAEWERVGDDVTVICDDGDTAIIYVDGKWNWTSE